jgi:hypothetical protein
MKKKVLTSLLVAPKRGKPKQLIAGKRYNVYLDQPSITKAMRLGNGNVSEGIRKALKQR